MDFYTPVNQIATVIQDTRSFYNKGLTRSFEWRKNQLLQLRKCLEENKEKFNEALQKDLKRSANVEINVVNEEMNLVLNLLDDWAKPEAKQILPHLSAAGGTGKVYKEPLGVVLIIGPWNYPLMLIGKPLIGAIGAGNCVVIKPSEVSENTARLIAELFPKYLDQRCVKIINGGVDETTEVLKHRFDHILYTGNGTVGRIVMKAASAHLTPVTLELGGKSPVIIDSNVDLSQAIPKIAFGKFMNAGQACISPDYILCHKDRYNEFLVEFKNYILKTFGENPKESPAFGKMINTRHTRRVAELIKGGKVYYGGEVDEANTYIAPTIIIEPDLNSKLMKEEIFGPLLPVIAVDSIDEAVQFVNERDKPLAAYVFSNDREFAEETLNRMSFGGGCVNETMVHAFCIDLPFGGVGESGIGSYFGKYSLDVFSHHKSVLSTKLGASPSTH